MLQFIRNIRSSGKTWVLALTALTVVSCAKDLGAPEIVERAGLTVRLTVPQSVEREMRGPRTYAETEPGYGQENEIEALHITFYSRSKDALGAWATWRDIVTKTLEKGDFPDFTGTAGGNPTADVPVEGIPVTPSALKNGTQLMAVIYANYKTPPGTISAESEFWKETEDTQTLKPLFFTGAGEFREEADGTWKANVSLTRQVAKLRIRAGIHPDAVPSTLEIDPQSIRVEVTQMANSSSTTDDQSDPGDKFNAGEMRRNISRTAVVTLADETASPLRLEKAWTDEIKGMQIDSLYMHPHDAGTTEGNATVVKVSMKVSDPVTAESKTLTLTRPLGKLPEGETQKDYTIRRNTIYTLDVQVQSIEGESLNANLEIHDWDDTGIDIDAPWGEAVTSHSVICALPGEGSTVMTVTTGGGTEPYSVTLVKPDNKSETLDGAVAALYRDGALATGNTFLLEPSSKATVQLSPSAQFAGAWLKIVKTREGQPAGLARYIPVGKAEFSARDLTTPTYVGGEFSCPEITCRATLPDGTVKTLEWTAEFVDVSDTPIEIPEWLTNCTLSGTNGESIRVNMAAQKNRYPMPWSAQVTGYDLSTRGGQTAINTANCYLVHNPGTYSFPLVYGNAVEDGQTNESAYKLANAPTGTGAEYILQTFVNYQGSPITSPYIYNGITITAARLLWQDVDGMIEDVALDNVGNRITFRVTDKIDYGNAVLAAVSGADIVWSWHIWATDYDPYAGGGTMAMTNRVSPNTSFDFMTQNLGWCPKKEYEEREARIKVTLPETGATRTITVRQNYAYASFNNTYYQWGRKDPMPGIIAESMGATANLVNKPTFGPDEYIWPSSGNDKNTPGEQCIETDQISEFIKHPWQFNKRANMSEYSNLWNMLERAHYKDDSGRDLTSASVVKTIYDPSPAGFCIPPTGAFEGFFAASRTGASSNCTVTASNSTGAWTFGDENACLYFYCGLDKTGETNCFPALGCRFGAVTGDKTIPGTASSLNSTGYYWSVIPDSNTSGLNMTFTRSTMSLIANPSRLWGYSVRSVKEN